MASHTNTGEWQSFEARMRRRRAERLALRADILADAGWIEEAEACLEEGRGLLPSLPEFARVEQKLRDATPDAIPIAPHSKRKLRLPRGTLPAAAALLLIATAAGSLRGTHPIRPTREFRSVTTLVAANPPRGVAFRLKAEGTAAVIADAMAPTAVASPATIAPPVTIASPVTIAPPMTSTFRRKSETSPAGPSPRPVPANAVEAAAMSAPSPELEAAAAAAPAVTPGAEAAAPIPAPAFPAAPLAERPENVLVRSALDRYAAAYSALDADAAQRVWPHVNRAALTRAFETLASQRLTLGACRVDVAGANARASCAGSATWAPKIGSGSSRTDRRRWDFELAKTDEGWQIVNARVQNR